MRRYDRLNRSRAGGDVGHYLDLLPIELDEKLFNRVGER
jgi:hypothetical protein